jgi:molybdopterin/thiamine biosynthesis adenylyltransferase
MDRRTLSKTIEEMALPIGKHRVISLEQVHELSKTAGSIREVELTALELEIIPARYLLNLGMIGIDGQLQLLRARVAIVGLGGLGGYVTEGLARMGVGCLVLIDGDQFEDHNLNRQLLSSESRLGVKKVEAACQRVAEINGAVMTVGHAEMLTKDNLPHLLDGVDVVVDALDRLPTRLILQDGAQVLGIPMIHGSIGGFLGQVMTIFPEDPGLHALYGNGNDLPQQGLESELGTPAATPMAVAAWEVQEVVKILTDRGEPLRDRLLVLDMESGAVEVLKLR